MGDTKAYCEQCGEEFEDGDDTVYTCFNHLIHEDCLDDYLDELKQSFEYEIYHEGRTEYEEMYNEFVDEEVKYLNEEED